MAESDSTQIDARPTVRLPPEILPRLRRLATVQHRSMAGQIAHMVDREFATLTPEQRKGVE